MKKRLSVRKTDIVGTPFEVVSQLTHVPDLVFMDSSGNLPENYKYPLSIIAVSPKKIIKGEDCKFSKVRKSLKKFKTTKGIPKYIPQGGAFGWIDYDGSFCFGIYENCLIYDHSESQWYEVGEVLDLLGELSLIPVSVGVFQPHMDRDEYLSKVHRIQEYIRSGDIYQVNMTQKFSTKEFSGDLFGLYESLRDSAPAPMAAFLSLGGREVLSSSPETFLSMQKRHVETRPIKGTRPRFSDPVLDEQSAQDLLASSKENAELVMITDLERNDLGQICEFGSVKVDEMLKLEKLEHVYHLVSTVSGKIRKGLDHLDVLKACFPGGSITGAPKKRAMEIIDELETEKRGLYTGAIGYIGIGGASQFNIVIRTLVKESNTLHYHVGAGIVADSDAEAEYAETLHKAKGMQKACAKHLKR